MGREEGRESGSTGDWIKANYIPCFLNYVKMNPNAMYIKKELIKNNNWHVFPKNIISDL